MHFRSTDADIFYEVLGSGPSLVLLHPFPAHHGIWMPAAQLLSTRFRCIVPDLRGHGRSEIGNFPATMQKHAEDLDRLCREENIDRAVFAGSSIGGYILFEFWRRFRPRVQALILCGTRAQADSPETRADRLSAIKNVQSKGPAEFLDAQAERLVGATTHRNRPDLAAQARAMMNSMTVEAITAIQQGMAERPDSVAPLATINVPTLILAGDEDPVAPRADAELMAQRIPRATMHLLPRAGHYLVFEKSQEVAEVIQKWIVDSR
jgi:3-oxoadipate enol-lactonase